VAEWPPGREILVHPILIELLAALIEAAKKPDTEANAAGIMATFTATAKFIDIAMSPPKPRPPKEQRATLQ
jgi:hypothetical protein